MCFAPPLVISKEEIDQALNKLDLVITKAENKFGITK
jgi:acetylornithine/succinyldiaminopimelate/putrescine aminotransferase